MKTIGETSDGYHTFDELYLYRMLYNAAFFNELARRGVYDVHKSVRHSDGDVIFGGEFFIVVAALPTGQISNHYTLGHDLEHWYLFDIPIRDIAVEYDGHSPAEAATRLFEFLKIPHNQ
jgi:hypothetical protein